MPTLLTGGCRTEGALLLTKPAAPQVRAKPTVREDAAFTAVGDFMTSHYSRRADECRTMPGYGEDPGVRCSTGSSTRLARRG